MAKSPRWKTVSSGPTTEFHRAIISRFISSTELKGREQYLMMFTWLKCVSLVKNTALDQKV